MIFEIGKAYFRFCLVRVAIPSIAISLICNEELLSLLVRSFRFCLVRVAIPSIAISLISNIELLSLLVRKRHLELLHDVLRLEKRSSAFVSCV